MSICKHCDPMNCAPDLCGARPKVAYSGVADCPPRALKSLVFNAEECSIQAGDVISFTGVYKRLRWWQFWRWFRKPKPRQLKLFVVQEHK